MQTNVKLVIINKLIKKLCNMQGYYNVQYWTIFCKLDILI